MSNIVFFGGKGGVGKTTSASAYSVAMARRGERVLLVSTDPAHSTSDIFEQKIGPEIVTIRENLDGLEIDPEREATAYLKGIRENLQQVISPIIVDEIKRQLDAASVSPGTHEAALFDKMIAIINDTSDTYDHLVFDTAPTGHTIRLLTLPELLNGWIASLIKKRRSALQYHEMAFAGYQKDIFDDPVIKILTRRRNQIDNARNIMIDQSRLSFTFVLNAERLPIEETKKAVAALEKYKIPIKGLVVNRILPDNPTDDFWREKKRLEGEYLERIRREFKGKQLTLIPLLAHDMDRTTLDRIADYF